MFTIVGGKYRHCDGVSRRDFLMAGAMGFAGITLADLNRIEAKSGIKNSKKAVINIHLDGGPPQMDTIDLIPDAPAEIRGEFSPISTCLPGVQICELMPQMAAMADRFSFLRSLVGAAGRAGGAEALTGAAAGFEGCGLAAGGAGLAAAVGLLGAAAFFTDRIAFPGAAGLAAAVAGLAPFPPLFSRLRIFPASASLIELLWLLAAIDSFSAASSTSLFSRPRSLDSS